MRTFVAVALVATVAFAAVTDIDLDFLQGLNLTQAITDFTYRFTTAQVFSPAFGTFLTWKSASVDPATSSKSKKASANAMIGIGALPGVASVPFSVLAYADGEAAVDTKVLSFAGMLISATPSLDVNFEGGVIATAALDMQECEPDGTPVGKRIPFLLPLFASSEEQEIVGDDGNVTGLTRTFSPSGTSAEVTVTYVASKKAGVLKYGKTPVSPRSYEMIIEVNHFPLTSSKNHIRMDVALLSAAGAGNVHGHAVIVPRLSSDPIYSAASDYAVVDGKRVEVKVTMEVAPADLPYLTDAILKAGLGGDFDAEIAHVDFPAGASSFIYDPAVGAGTEVYSAFTDEASSSTASAGSSTTSSGAGSSAQPAPASSQHGSAATSALSLLVALVCVLVYLF